MKIFFSFVFIFILNLPLYSNIKDNILATINGKKFITSSQFVDELQKFSPNVRKSFSLSQKKDMLNALIARKLISLEMKKNSKIKSPFFWSNLSYLRRTKILSSFVLKLKNRCKVTDEVRISDFYKKHGKILYPGEDISKCRQKISEKLSEKKLEKTLDKIYKDTLSKNRLITGEISLFFNEYFDKPDYKFNDNFIYKFKNNSLFSANFSDFLGMINAMMKNNSKIDVKNLKQQKYLLDKFLKSSVIEFIAKKEKIDKNDPLYTNLKNLKINLMNKWYLLKNSPKIKVSEKDIKDFYKKNINYFKIEPMVNVDIIEVETARLGKDILKKLKNNENFNKLASKFSTHISGKNGGHLGYIKLNSRSMEFLWPAFIKLKKGEISNLIKTKDGYFIVKLIDKINKKNIELNKVHDRIKFLLFRQKEKINREKLTEKLIKKYGVKVFPENLKNITFK